MLFEAVKDPFPEGHAAGVMIAETVVETERAWILRVRVQPDDVASHGGRPRLREAHEGAGDASLLVPRIDHQAVDDRHSRRREGPRHVGILRALVLVDHQGGDQRLEIE